VIFYWDEKGWQSFVSDPEVPPILKEAGHMGKPWAAMLRGQYNAWQELKDIKSLFSRMFDVYG
jgi:hypothetical protein